VRVATIKFPMNSDILLTHGTVITMDPERRIIEDGAVAVHDGRIAAVGNAQEIQQRYRSDQTIDCGHHIVMPGLIDAHSHSFEAMFKTFLVENYSSWLKILPYVDNHLITDDFYYIDGRLSALDRLKCGVTTGLVSLGCEPRTDDPIFGFNNAKAHSEVGIREVLALGPGVPPWPRKYGRVKDGEAITNTITFDQVMETTEAVIQAWNHAAGDRIRVYVNPYTIVTSVDPSNPSAPDVAVELTDFDRFQMKSVRELAEKYQTRIHSDAFGGMIRMVYEEDYALLGPDVHLQHCMGISFDEACILAETGTHVSSSPYPDLSIARCPVPELLELGVKVAISTDAYGPGALLDLFETARRTQLVHRLLNRDMFILPAGKLLEMITIDAAKVIGWDDEIGSLETGKKADIITVDLRSPHMVPEVLPVHRVIHQANGNDVDNVIVDGKILMQDRAVLTVGEEAVYDEANAEFIRTMERAGLTRFLTMPKGFWGSMLVNWNEKKKQFTIAAGRKGSSGS
jgi:5-methylthioadenosine/S-adenosylhomocysteine deaminase